MLDRAMEQMKKNKRDAQEEIKRARKSRLYNGWDTGKEKNYCITYNGVEYHISPQHIRVVDNYDSSLDSIEQSHYESVGYSIIDGYKFIDDDVPHDMLDFTFAKIEDKIEIKLEERISEVKLNSINLRYASFEGKHNVFFNIVFDMNVIDNALSFKRFIEKHKGIIRSINIQGVAEEDLLAKLIKKTCASNNIFILTFKSDQDSNKKLQKNKPTNM